MIEDYTDILSRDSFEADTRSSNDMTGIWNDSAAGVTQGLESGRGGGSGDYDGDVESVAAILVPVLFGVVTVVGCVGNLLVILVVTFNRQMRSTTNLLIISLAMADLLFVIFCVPFTAVRYIMSSWPLGRVWCKLYQYLIQVTVYASVYTLVLMSVDRYLAVVHPVRSISIRTERNTSLAVIIMWTIIGLLNIYVPLEYDIITYGETPNERSDCINIYIYEEYQTSAPQTHARLIHIIFFLIGYALPLALICVLYGLMLRRFLCGASPGMNQSASRALSKKRVTRMVVLVVVVFAVCWLPIHCLFLAIYVGNVERTSLLVLLQVFFTCLAYTNSCLNPIFYAFISANFRKSFSRLLCCQTLQTYNNVAVSGTRAGDHQVELTRGDKEQPSRRGTLTKCNYILNNTAVQRSPLIDPSKSIKNSENAKSVQNGHSSKTY